MDKRAYMLGYLTRLDKLAAAFGDMNPGSVNPGPQAPNTPQINNTKLAPVNAQDTAKQEMQKSTAALSSTGDTGKYASKPIGPMSSETFNAGGKSNPSSGGGVGFGNADNNVKGAKFGQDPHSTYYTGAATEKNPNGYGWVKMNNPNKTPATNMTAGVPNNKPPMDYTRISPKDWRVPDMPSVIPESLKSNSDSNPYTRPKDFYKTKPNTDANVIAKNDMNMADMGIKITNSPAQTAGTAGVVLAEAQRKADAKAAPQKSPSTATQGLGNWSGWQSWMPTAVQGEEM